MPSSYSGIYTIPDGITTICKGAFYECKELTSINIPNSVLSINDFAFAYCESLTSIVIPYGVKVIGECVFTGCKSLIALSIPESVISIKEQAFAECNNLKCINFPNNLEEIETDAFSDCKNLNTIILPESLSYIGARAFSGCIGLKSITNLSKQPQHITEDVFEGVDKTMCKLRIPTESIDDYWLSDGWDLFDNLLYKKDCVIYNNNPKQYLAHKTSQGQIIEWNQQVRREVVRICPDLTIEDWEKIEEKLRLTTDSLIEAVNCKTYASNLL